ncbi:hypothetical protein O7635_34285 [Asanoa sp. WMMD1127]|uniref:hypothetical protein n=1 Tax=Asanoa sp. WMMD1127 TaxID=3016107 RepID=UPI002416228A|nr:hypothetical protein [Asanoa sp. WMMD1127]MDG4826942.1 hypothetical protein [Asanoa sp. WMMD1127]
MFVRRRLVPLALGLVGVLGAGCTGAPAPPAATARSSAAAPSPTADADAAREELITALERSAAVPHTYAVRADLPEGQRVKGTGAIDLKRKRFQTAVTMTGGKYPGAGNRIVLGTDSYQRESSKDSWVHLYLERVRADDTLVGFDWTDPTGLKAFTKAIGRVERTGPHTYTGRVDPTASYGEPFLPVGAPALWSIGLDMSPFTVTTDAKGWVTSIEVTLTPRDSKRLTMSTSMSGHGKPLAVRKPARFAEAAEFYYD